MKTILKLAMASMSLLFLPALLKAQSSNMLDVVNAEKKFEKHLKSAADPCNDFVISYMESSSNGLGGGSTLCNHPYDFDDYVNTFRAWLNQPFSVGAITLHYEVWDGFGNIVSQGNIYNFSDTNSYALPATLPVGFYSIIATVTVSGCPDVSEYYELPIEYANCGGK